MTHPTVRTIAVTSLVTLTAGALLGGCDEPYVCPEIYVASGLLLVVDSRPGDAEWVVSLTGPDGSTCVATITEDAPVVAEGCGDVGRFFDPDGVSTSIHFDDYRTERPTLLITSDGTVLFDGMLDPIYPTWDPQCDDVIRTTFNITLDGP